MRLAESGTIYFGAYAEAAALEERVVKTDPEAAQVLEDLMLFGVPLRD